MICCIPRNITDQQFSLSKKPGQEDVSIGLASDTGIVDNIFNINNQNSNNQWRTTTTYRPHLTTRYTTPRALSTKRPQEFSYQFEKSTPVPQYSPPSTFRPSFQSNNIPNRKVVIAPNLQKPISNQEGLVTNNFGGAQRPTSVSQSNSPSRPSASFGGSNDAAEGTCKRVNADNINAFNKNFWDVLDYPHVVAVGIHRVINGRSQQTWKCVGSIIHENYILASASCIRNDDPRKPEQEVNVILITDRNLNNSYEDDKLERITKISYNGEIALIKLQRKLE